MRTIISLVLTFISVAAQAQSMDLLWRARGLEAEEKVAKIEKKDQSKLTKEDRCNLIIEKAFAKFAKKENTDFLISKKPYLKQKATSLSLVLESETSVDALIGFSYIDGSSNPFMIDTIITTGASKEKPGWSMVLMLGRPKGSFILTNGDCAFAFDKDNYLYPKLEK